jgi:hypothetical protein
MSKPERAVKLQMPTLRRSHEGDNNAALVNFSTIICGVLIKDSFLWLKSNRSVVQMKLFAVNLLAEHLDRQTFISLDPRDVERK